MAAAARVFITGASSGIGEALAREYARRGATVGLVARRLDRLEALAEQLGKTAACYGADVRDANALRTAADDFVEARLRIEQPLPVAVHDRNRSGPIVSSNGHGVPGIVDLLQLS